MIGGWRKQALFVLGDHLELALADERGQVAEGLVGGRLVEQQRLEQRRLLPNTRRAKKSSTRGSSGSPERAAEDLLGQLGRGLERRRLDRLVVG